MPNSPALAGLVSYDQMVPFELDAGMRLVAVTATNAEPLTIGSFGRPDAHRAAAAEG